MSQEERLVVTGAAAQGATATGRKGPVQGERRLFRGAGGGSATLQMYSKFTKWSWTLEQGILRHGTYTSTNQPKGPDARVPGLAAPAVRGLSLQGEGGSPGLWRCPCPEPVARPRGRPTGSWKPHENPWTSRLHRGSPGHARVEGGKPAAVDTGQRKTLARPASKTRGGGDTALAQVPEHLTKFRCTVGRKP